MFSNSTRFKEVKSDTPGPGSYDVKARRSSVAPGFGGEKRFKDAPVADTPGPGSYSSAENAAAVKRVAMTVNRMYGSRCESKKDVIDFIQRIIVDCNTVSVDAAHKFEESETIRARAKDAIKMALKPGKHHKGKDTDFVASWKAYEPLERNMDREAAETTKKHKRLADLLTALIEDWQSLSSVLVNPDVKHIKEMQDMTQEITSAKEAKTSVEATLSQKEVELEAVQQQLSESSVLSLALCKFALSMDDLTCDATGFLPEGDDVPECSTEEAIELLQVVAARIGEYKAQLDAATTHGEELHKVVTSVTEQLAKSKQAIVDVNGDVDAATDAVIMMEGAADAADAAAMVLEQELMKEMQAHAATQSQLEALREQHEEEMANMHESLHTMAVVNMSETTELVGLLEAANDTVDDMITAAIKQDNIINDADVESKELMELALAGLENSSGLSGALSRAKDTIEQLEEKSNELNNKLSDAEAKQSETDAALFEQQTIVASLTEKLADANSTIAHGAEIITETNGMVEALQEELSATKAEMESERADAIDVMSKLQAETTAHAAEQSERISSLEGDLSTTTTTLEETKVSLTSSEERVNELEGELAETTSDLTGKLNTANENIVKLEEEKAQFESTVASMTTAAEEAAAIAIATANEHAEVIAKAEEEMRALQSEFDSFKSTSENTVDELNGKFDGATADIAKLEEEKAQLESTVASMTTAAEEAAAIAIATANEHAEVIAKAEEEMRALQSEFDSFKSTSENTVDELNGKIAELEMFVIDARAQCKELQGALATMDAESDLAAEKAETTINDLTTQLTDTQSTLASTTEQLNATIAALEADAVQLRATIAENMIASKETVTSYTAEMATLQGELVDAHSAMSQLQAETTAHAAEQSERISSLEGDLSMTTTTLEETKVSLTSSEKRVNELEGELAETNTTMAELKETTSATSTEQQAIIASLEKNVADMTTAAEEAAATHASTVATLEVDIAAKVQAFDELTAASTATAEEHTETIANLESEIVTKTATIAERDAAVASLESDLESMTDAKEKAVTEIEELCAAATSTSAIMEEERVTAAAVASDLEATKEALAAAAERGATLSERVSSLDSELASLTEEFTTAMDAGKKVQSELTTKLDESNASLGSLRSELADVMAEAAQLAKDLADMEDAKATADADLNSAIEATREVESRMAEMQQSAHDAYAALKAQSEETQAALQAELDAAVTSRDDAMAQKGEAEELASQVYADAQAGLSHSRGPRIEDDEHIDDASHIAALKGRVQSLETDLAASLDEKEEWLLDMQKLRASEREARDETEKLTIQVENYVTKVALMTKTNKSLEAEAAKLTAQNVQLVGHQNTKQKVQYHAKVKEENNDLKKKLLKMDNELERLRRADTLMRRELAKLQGTDKDGVDFESEVRLQQALRKSEDDLREARGHMHALASQISSVKSALARGDDESVKENIAELGDIVVDMTTPSKRALGTPAKRRDSLCARDSLSGSLCDNSINGDDVIGAVKGETFSAHQAVMISELATKCESGLDEIARVVKKQVRDFEDAELRIRLLEKESTILKRRTPMAPGLRA